MNIARATSLEAALAAIESADVARGAVVAASVWRPDPAALGDYRAWGIDATPTLELTLRLEDEGAAWVKILLELMGLECVAEEAARDGVSYSFVLREVL